MDADLDTLCTVIYCTADDLLPEARANARRRISDAELVTLCVAQAIMGIPSDRRFLRAARREAPRPPLPEPAQPARLLEAPAPPGRRDRVAHGRVREPRARASRTTCCWSTRPRCPAPPAVRRSSVRRSVRPPATATAPPTRAGTGAFACTFSLRLTAHRGRSPWPIRARGEREVALELLGRAARGGELLVCDKGYAGRELRRSPQPSSGASSCARSAATSADAVRTWRPSASASRSIFWTCKDLLTLERHGARTLAGLRERILQRFLCLAACISLNHRLGRPSRALVDYCA